MKTWRSKVQDNLDSIRAGIAQLERMAQDLQDEFDTPETLSMCLLDRTARLDAVVADAEKATRPTKRCEDCDRRPVKIAELNICEECNEARGQRWIERQVESK